MANFSATFGLEDLMEDDEIISSLLQYIVKTGKEIPSYYGYPYIFKSFGTPEYFVRLRPDSDGNLECFGLDSHCSGNSIWEVEHSGIDLSPKEKPTLNRVIMMNSTKEKGMVPIELITADVYPSFLEGDRYKVQVIGLALNVRYFPDEDAYMESVPEDAEGRKWGIANGSLIPVEFLYNHDPKRNEGFDPQTDQIVSFMGTVKRFKLGYINFNGEGKEAFVKCIIDTQFGELEIAHAMKDIPEEQINLMKAGSVVGGTCILSGDLAIDQYEDGIIKDHEHDLRLLRYTFVKGEEERLKTVLREDAIYESDSSGKTISGRGEIIQQIRYVIDNMGCNLITNMATIISSDEGMEYPVGTRCFVMAYGEDKDYEAITFIDVDGDGMISRIRVSNDSRYRFQIDDEEKSRSFLEDAELLGEVSEAVFMRARLLGIVDREILFENYEDEINKRDDYTKLTHQLLETAKYYLKTGPAEWLENMYSNLFVRRFTERLLQEVGVSLPEPGVQEMFSAEMHFPLNTEWDECIRRAKDYGRTFYKDFKLYASRETLNDLVECDLIDVAVFVQGLGKTYAEKHMKDAPIVYTPE